MISYALNNDRVFRDYVVPFTNAATIINEGYRDTEDLGGVFSGWDEETKRYDSDSWKCQGAPPAKYDERAHGAAGQGSAKDWRLPLRDKKQPKVQEMQFQEEYPKLREIR